jgi:hypothetical protein
MIAVITSLDSQKRFFGHSSRQLEGTTVSSLEERTRGQSSLRGNVPDSRERYFSMGTCVTNAVLTPSSTERSTLRALQSRSQAPSYHCIIALPPGALAYLYLAGSVINLCKGTGHDRDTYRIGKLLALSLIRLYETFSCLHSAVVFNQCEPP